MPEDTTSGDVTPQPNDEPQPEPVQPVVLTGDPIPTDPQNTGDGPSSNDAPQFPAGENPVENSDADGPSSDQTSGQFPADEVKSESE